jgi:hypothetical protein
MPRILPLLLAVLLGCGDPDSSSPGSTSEATDRSPDATRNPGGIDYIPAKGWFVRNDFPDMTLMTMLLESQSSFDEVLGAAATMGPDRRPTPIDFSKQSAIALIAPETDTAITLQCTALQPRNGQLHLTYRRKLGERQSFTTRPLLLLLVDRDRLAPVVLEEG